jgi:hypothetical protein
MGEFGASEYLFQQIKLHVPPQLQSSVVRPMDPVSAVVKGTVTAGIYHCRFISSLAMSRRAGRRAVTSGPGVIPLEKLFQKNGPMTVTKSIMVNNPQSLDTWHPEQYKRLYPDGHFRADHALQTLVEAGKTLVDKQSLVFKMVKFFQPGGPDPFFHTLSFWDGIYSTDTSSGDGATVYNIGSRKLLNLVPQTLSRLVE